MKPIMTARIYAAELQKLIDAGYGDLPLVHWTEDGLYCPGAEGNGPAHEASVEYQDCNNTSWSYRRGPAIIA